MIPGARLIILGRQGAGKGTQCVRLSRHYVVPHISTGDMLRAAAREGSELGLMAKQIMEEGGLVGDEVMIGLVDERLRKPDADSRGYILDGFPRTVAQAQALQRITDDKPIHVVIDLDVPREIVLERLSSRGCAATAARTTRPSVADDRRMWICDVCGGDVAAARRRHARRGQPPPRPVRDADGAADRRTTARWACMVGRQRGRTPRPRVQARSATPSTPAADATPLPGQSTPRWRTACGVR